jgi:hypothetical protein
MGVGGAWTAEMRPKCAENAGKGIGAPEERILEAGRTATICGEKSIDNRREPTVAVETGIYVESLSTVTCRRRDRSMVPVERSGVRKQLVSVEHT